MNTQVDRVVFPDTNAIIHYPPIADTDWCRLLGVRSLKIIICMQVVRELDDLKRDPHYARRARRAIREIEGLRQQNEVRKDVNLALFQDEPKASEFPDSLDPERKDDRIIAAVLAFSRSHPEKTVVVVSEDYGMKLRCESHRLVTVGPDQGTRLDDPSDEKTKKIRQLQEEVTKLSGRLPELQVRAATPLSTGPAPCIVKLQRPPTLKYDNLVAEERERLRMQVPRGPLIGLMGVSPQQVENYNARVEEYLKEYRAWLPGRQEVEEAERRTFAFDVEVSNIGGRPAEGVDIYLTFPSFVVAARAEDEEVGSWPAAPESPKPPKPPKSSLEQMIVNIIPGTFPTLAGHSYLDFPHVPGPPPSDWISLTQSENIITAQLHIDKLKNDRFAARFRDIQIRLKSWDDARTFKVPFEISADNIPETGTGKLIFQIEVEGTCSG